MSAPSTTVSPKPMGGRDEREQLLHALSRLGGQADHVLELPAEKLDVKLLRQVGLVQHRNGAVARRTGKNEHVLLPHRPRAVEHRENERRRGRFRHRAVDARLFDGVGRVAQSRRIGHAEQDLADLDVFLDKVARRAGNIGNDSAFASEKRVQQGGFSRIRGGRE